MENSTPSLFAAQFFDSPSELAAALAPPAAAGHFDELRGCKSSAQIASKAPPPVVAPVVRDASMPLDLDEMLGLFCDASGASPQAIDRRARTETSHDFAFERLRVQLTMWPDLGSSTRGRLTPEGEIVPFFEHLLANEGGY